MNENFMNYNKLEVQWKNNWFNFIKNNLNCSWFWKYISVNKNLTFDMINDNPQLPWDTCDKYYSLNPNITWNDVPTPNTRKWSTV